MHTPGPWHQSTHGTDSYIWGANERTNGCVARVNLCRTSNVTSAEREANAMLIAAAPDLLAASVMLRHWLPETDDLVKLLPHGKHHILKALADLDTAIAKATQPCPT